MVSSFRTPCLMASLCPNDAVRQVEREIQVQRNLKHENVLRLYKHFEVRRAVSRLLQDFAGMRMQSYLVILPDEVAAFA